ncbi:MAG: plasmid pRiA4b ORF-3 family protein [Opitutaceae bacterium]
MISLHEGRGPRRKRPASRVLTLLLQVPGCEPRGWRRLVVRESIWLSQLHDSIQLAFDWFDYQTHTFALGSRRFGNPVAGAENSVDDDRDVLLADLGLEEGQRLAYRYHFGEGWEVDVLVESAGPAEKGVRYPVCLAGERAGPPEDCGGMEAFHDMLACLADPASALGREWREWLGPDYKPEACDPAAITTALRRLKQR